jgi:hypothetical protein
MALASKWFPLLSTSIALLILSAGSGCRPALVEVEGQVMMNGQPLPQAQIHTHPSNDRWPGASGMSDDQGHFRLTTFIDNGFQSGAFVGDHQVTVVVEEPGLGGFGVTVLSPEKYASPNSSEITLTVTSGQPVRAWKIEMQGVLKSATSAEQIGSGAHAGEGYIAIPVFQQFDRNKDDRLDAEEQEQVDTDLLHGVDLDTADTNNDGFVDREELKQASENAFGSEDAAESPTDE